jgi:hypothetical protein
MLATREGLARCQGAAISLPLLLGPDISWLHDHTAHTKVDFAGGSGSLRLTVVIPGMRGVT